MKINLLKKPFFKEAKVIDGVDTIVFDDLGPDGATLSVTYAGMKPGDIVQAWGLLDPWYDQRKTVPEGVSSLTFKVGKENFERRSTVMFQFFIRDEDDGMIGVSDNATYKVTGSFPAPLPAPTIQEAVDGEIVVENLPASGATLLVDYPGKAGDKITILFTPPYSKYKETKVFIGASPMIFKVPMTYFREVLADGGRATVHQYLLSDSNDSPVQMSGMTLYGLG